MDENGSIRLTAPNKSICRLPNLRYSAQFSLNSRKETKAVYKHSISFFPKHSEKYKHNYFIYYCYLFITFLLYIYYILLLFDIALASGVIVIIYYININIPSNLNLEQSRLPFSLFDFIFLLSNIFLRQVSFLLEIICMNF
jgi:hypothetical protein